MPGALETFFVSILGGIGTGVVGLVALHFQQRFTANSEQISATLAELDQMVLSCAEVASRAWGQDGDPSSTEAVETVCQLHTIGVFIAFIIGNVKASRIRLTPALLNFREASSGGQFDVKGRAPLPDRAIDIRNAAASLRISLRTVDYDRRSIHIPWISH